MLLILNSWRHFAYFLKDFALYLALISISFIALIFASSKIYRLKIAENKRKIILAVLFSIFSAILIYSCIEAYFRYRFDQSDSLGFLKVNFKWFQRHVVFNSYFVRDRDFDQKKKKGRIRIGVIGDSTAMGYGIKDVNNRFSNILEKKLKDKEFDVEVYNLGKSGYDTDQEVDEYNSHFKSLDFDIIIWEYFLNDAESKDKSRGTQVLLKEQAQSKPIQFISNYSYFFDYIYWRLAARYEKTFRELRNADMAAYQDKENFSHHKQSVVNFIKQLKDENRKVAVIIFPFLVFFPNYPANDIHVTMNKIFRENGIEPIDLLDDLKDKKSKDLIVSSYDYHPNESVHKIAAQRLYDKILPLLNKNNQ